MIKNKYYDCYNSIIDNAKSQNRVKGEGIFYENHHILPKSLGGDNTKNNLVFLTAKEHVICHHLLTKFTEGTDKVKMNYAFWSLVNGWGDHRNEHKITARQYEKLKEEIAKQISLNNKGKTGSPRSQEQREAARQRMLLHCPWQGKPPHNKGKKRPGVGGRKKGSGWSEAERKKQMEARSQPGYYDFLKDPERGRKISESQKGRPGTSTGTVWCNDGIREYQVTEIPEGFKKGRLITNSSKVGMRWFTNGIDNRQFRDGEQPEGFKYGRISKK